MAERAGRRIAKHRAARVAIAGVIAVPRTNALVRLDVLRIVAVAGPCDRLGHAAKVAVVARPSDRFWLGRPRLDFTIINVAWWGGAHRWNNVRARGAGVGRGGVVGPKRQVPKARRG